MLSEQNIEQFFIDVQALNLKFPVADLAKATGYVKGNVSDFLNKKKPVPERFIKLFYEKVYSTKSVPQGTAETLPPITGDKDKSIEYLSFSTKSLAESVAKMVQMLDYKFNSNGIGLASSTSGGEGISGKSVEHLPLGKEGIRGTGKKDAKKGILKHTGS